MLMQETLLLWRAFKQCETLRTLKYLSCVYIYREEKPGDEVNPNQVHKMIRKVNIKKK